jgi:hypothetical protein
VRGMPALLALLAAAVVMAGCGESAVSSGKAAEGQPSSSVSSDEGVSATTATDPPQSTAAVNEMSVFVRPRTDADVLPSRLSYRLRPKGRCTDWQRADFGCPGDPIADESRLLLSGLGVRKDELVRLADHNWRSLLGLGRRSRSVRARLRAR